MLMDLYIRGVVYSPTLWPLTFQLVPVGGLICYWWLTVAFVNNTLGPCYTEKLPAVSTLRLHCPV